MTAVKQSGTDNDTAKLVKNSRESCCLFDSLIILNSQDLKSDFLDSRLEGSTLSRTDHRCATPKVPCGPSHCRKPRPSAPDLTADHQFSSSRDLSGLARRNSSGRRRFQRPGKHITERRG